MASTHGASTSGPMQAKNTFKVAYDKTLLEIGVKHAITYDLNRLPHMLIIGATGSGKTFFLKTILGRIGLNIPNSKVFLCNYKADDDFHFLRGCPRYYEFNKCQEGLNEVYNAILSRQSNIDQSRDALILAFDEFAAYISNVADKKTAEEEKRKLSTLLMLGRSFNIHIFVSQQRGDAQFFSTARDNFSAIIAFGNLSNESKQMFFSEYKDQMAPVSDIGAGYMITNNGARLRQIQVPFIRDTSKLEVCIKKTVTDE